MEKEQKGKFSNLIFKGLYENLSRVPWVWLLGTASFEIKSVPLFKWYSNLSKKEREEKSVSPWILFWELQCSASSITSSCGGPAAEVVLYLSLQQALPAQQDVPTVQVQLSAILVKETRASLKASMEIYFKRKINNAFKREVALCTQDALQISINHFHLCNCSIFWDTALLITT